MVILPALRNNEESKEKSRVIKINNSNLVSFNYATFERYFVAYQNKYHSKKHSQLYYYFKIDIFAENKLNCIKIIKDCFRFYNPCNSTYCFISA